MKVIYRRHRSNWNQKLLCVTHTERPVESEKCSLNFLEKRYSNPNRLPPLETFTSLPPAYQFSPYLGQVTIWEFYQGDFTKPRLLAQLCPNPNGYKPQFAIWYNGKLWILGVEVIEVYNSNLTRIATITDPWLSAAHTLVPDNKGHLLVTCSASDSILVVDEKNYEIVKAIRMPESLYGFNYSLSRQDSTVDHYIDNDRQLTHVNCAWPWKEGILVSTLIQGAIGWFDKFGNYEELTRGFVGCHGARIDQIKEQIYFCDSCLGVVIFLSPTYTIDHRINVQSIWLHDAQQLSADIFALSVSDRNQIEIMDFSLRENIATIPGGDFGNSTQFVYYGK